MPKNHGLQGGNTASYCAHCKLMLIDAASLGATGPLAPHVMVCPQCDMPGEDTFASLGGYDVA